ncbi:MAG TPA: hypothetical protein DD723_09550 [Candidatus Omnitrophica bacterium]|nr:MAG: hypothetical protein A2Z81_02940 [Omnitrophica WOR_2 bacterium GWA2_45_18]OGX19016.1 MAG: hypothetical protein A2Y04_00670 [Omnitrophica WOR_2 bacterium GWC2_45_7]HBR15762.1 hypothetical protein [Candidatus Omnitrophota bacterium]
MENLYPITSNVNAPFVREIIGRLSLKTIFIYNCEFMTASMASLFSRWVLITYSAMSPEEGLRKIKEHDITLVIIDVIHFHPRCLMDFLDFKKDLWIAAINCNFLDRRYYEAKEFGANWVTSPNLFITSMPVILKMLSVAFGYNNLRESLRSSQEAADGEENISN